MIDLSPYDVLVVGEPETLESSWIKRLFANRKTLLLAAGVEVAPQPREPGLDETAIGIGALDASESSVRHVVLRHVLERCADRGEILDVLRSACRLASDVVLIEGSYFDAEYYLERLGLKFFWSDWSGHPSHPKSWFVSDCLREIGAQEVVIMGCGPIVSSDDPAVHPLTSPADQHDYDQQIHPPKSDRSFDRSLFRKVIICARLGPLVVWPHLLRSIRETYDAAVLRSTGRGAPPEKPGGLAWDRRQVDLDLRTRARLREVRMRSLRQRGFGFIRSLHLRKVLTRLETVDSVLIEGTGGSLWSIALALEFPAISFEVRRSRGDGEDEAFDTCRALVDMWGLDNVRFGRNGIGSDPFDLVVGAAALGGSTRDACTVESLARRSRHFLWLLASFERPSQGRSADPGYDLRSFEELLSGYRILELLGARWRWAGAQLGEDVAAMGDAELELGFGDFWRRAGDDLVDEGPIAGQALEAWALLDVSV